MITRYAVLAICLIVSALSDQSSTTSPEGTTVTLPDGTTATLPDGTTTLPDGTTTATPFDDTVCYTAAGDFTAADGCCEKPLGCQLPDYVVGSGSDSVTFRRFIEIGSTTVFGKYEYMCVDVDGNLTAVATVIGCYISEFDKRMEPNTTTRIEHGNSVCAYKCRLSDNGVITFNECCESKTCSWTASTTDVVTPVSTSGPTGTPEVTTGPTGTSGPTTVHTGTPVPTTEPTGTPEMTTGPSGTPEVTTGPTGSSEPTTGQTGTPVSTTEPTGTPETTTGPTGTPDVTTGPTGSSELTTGPTGTPEVTTGPTGTPEVATGPTNGPTETPGPTNGPTETQTTTETVPPSTSGTTTPSESTTTPPSTTTPAPACTTCNVHLQLNETSHVEGLLKKCVSVTYANGTTGAKLVIEGCVTPFQTPLAINETFVVDHSFHGVECAYTCKQNSYGTIKRRRNKGCDVEETERYQCYYTHCAKTGTIQINRVGDQDNAHINGGTQMCTFDRDNNAVFMPPLPKMYVGAKDWNLNMTELKYVYQTNSSAIISQPCSCSDETGFECPKQKDIGGERDIHARSIAFKYSEARDPIATEWADDEHPK